MLTILAASVEERFKKRRQGNFILLTDELHLNVDQNTVLIPLKLHLDKMPKAGHFDKMLEVVYIVN